MSGPKGSSDISNPQQNWLRCWKCFKQDAYVAIYLIEHPSGDTDVVQLCITCKAQAYQANYRVYEVSQNTHETFSHKAAKEQDDMLAKHRQRT